MLDWNARSRTFEKIAGFTPSVGGMVMAGADGNAETVSRQWVTAGIFDVLGVKPIAGRTFSADDEAKRANVVVMSEAFWRTRYNADPGVDRPRDPPRRIAVDGGRRRSEGFSAAGAEQPVGDEAARQPSSAGARAPTCCRWSDA